MMTTGVRLRENSKPVSQRLRAIAHPRRVAIITLLAHDPMTMHEIAENMDAGMTLVVHHLNILLKYGWVTKKRNGREMVYTLRTRPFTELLHTFQETPFGSTYRSNSTDA